MKNSNHDAIIGMSISCDYEAKYRETLDINAALREKNADLSAKYHEAQRALETLRAQMEVVRLIFGSNKKCG